MSARAYSLHTSSQWQKALSSWVWSLGSRLECQRVRRPLRDEILVVQVLELAGNDGGQLRIHRRRHHVRLPGGCGRGRGASTDSSFVSSQARGWAGPARLGTPPSDAVSEGERDDETRRNLSPAAPDLPAAPPIASSTRRLATAAPASTGMGAPVWVACLLSWLLRAAAGVADSPRLRHPPDRATSCWTRVSASPGPESGRDGSKYPPPRYGHAAAAVTGARGAGLWISHGYRVADGPHWLQDTWLAMPTGRNVSHLWVWHKMGASSAPLPRYSAATGACRRPGRCLGPLSILRPHPAASVVGWRGIPVWRRRRRRSVGQGPWGASPELLFPPKPVRLTQPISGPVQYTRGSFYGDAWLWHHSRGSWLPVEAKMPDHAPSPRSLAAAALVGTPTGHAARILLYGGLTAPNGALRPQHNASIRVS